MPVEFEAKFINIDINEIKKKLIQNGAKLEHKPLKFFRIVFTRCNTKTQLKGFVRARDEGNKVTLTSKIYPEGKEKYPEEYEVSIN